jgi:phosphate transport system substrate-binding protein
MKIYFAALIFLLAGASVNGQTILSGAGSTFVHPVMSKWTAEYEKSHAGVHVNYLPVGSGAGIAQVLRGMLDFGATDAPLTDQQVSQEQVKVLHVPVVLGADVAAYNIHGVSGDLRFTPQVLADIFLGKIVRWNDVAIGAVNRGIALPDKAITVVHRSDGSGTTYVWTDFLSKVSSEWREKVGKGTSVKWPVAGLEGKGNEGVADAIRQTDGAIGYVELAFAAKGNVPFGSIQNLAGVFIKPSIKSTAAAGDSLKTIPADLRISLTDAPGIESYPVVSLSWILIPLNLRGTPKGQAVINFLSWVLTDGQKFTTDLLYAPVPAAVSERARQALKQLQ